MKRLITIVITLLLSLPLFAQIEGTFIEQCATNAGEDATYLKDFIVILGEPQPNQRPPVARYPLVLSKNNIYRFSVCTTPNSKGKAIIELYESNKLIYSFWQIMIMYICASINIKCLLQIPNVHIFGLFQLNINLSIKSI